MLTGVLSKDWFSLSQKLRKESPPAGDITGDISAELSAQLEVSQKKYTQRQQRRPSISYDGSLPIHDQSEAIGQLLLQHQVLIVVGETGSGKSTQLPKLCLEYGRGIAGQIAHTQPRRIAARSIAARLSEEIGSPLGEHVGYKVRFQDKTQHSNYIKVLTDGMLLAESQTDKYLRTYDTIIIDEAHERSLNIDFLLGYMRWLLPKRPDLKLIITSATINSELFAQAFDAPVVNVSGRTYPVEIRYIDCLEEHEAKHQRSDVDTDTISNPETHFSLSSDNGSKKDDSLTMHRNIAAAISLLQKEARGDTLVFMATEAEINQAIQYCEKHAKVRAHYLPLYARLPSAQQDAIFHPKSGQTRIIFCTNVAETSLTVPNIKYVIDTGRARMSRYSWRLRVQRLPIEAISQASANQRSGRCGRTSDGIAIRLYEADDFEQRDAYTTAEIKRTNLASVILQMQLLKLGDIKQFPFIEAPENRYIKDGYRLLYEIKAVDADYRLTPLGQQIARVPIDPKYAAMLVAAQAHEVTQEIAAIVSGLVNPDVRLDSRQMINISPASGHEDEQTLLLKPQQHSDFITLLQRWLWLRQQQERLSRSQFNKFLSKHQLSYLRWHQWQDTYTQLIRSVQGDDRRPTANSNSATQTQDSARLISKLLSMLEDKQTLHNPYYHALHYSLLIGLPNNVAQLDKHEHGKAKPKDSKNAQKKRVSYLGSNNKKIAIHPGSVLLKSQPNWVMAAEIVDTSQLFARTVAKISPNWCLTSARHLLRYEYSEPHWHSKYKQVRAYERAMLYGLTLQAGKAVNYTAIAPDVCRQVFIQRALVEGALKENSGFLQHNRQQVRALQAQEAKTRRRDLVVSDEVLYEFYQQKLPPHIVNAKQLHSWQKHADQADVDALYLNAVDLQQNQLNEEALLGFPNAMMIANEPVKLSYAFELGAEDDGVTLHLPLHLAEQLNPHQLDYLVPGMLVEKVSSLLRSLPKSERKKYVPIGPFAQACVEAISDDAESQYDAPLTQHVHRHMWRMTGTEPDVSAWDSVSFEPHQLMRICLLDKRQRTLLCSRDIDEIQSQARRIIKDQVIAIEHTPEAKTEIHTVDDVKIDEHITLDSGVMIWPALSVQKTNDKLNTGPLSIDWFESETKAEAAHKKGITALLLKQHLNELKAQWKAYPEQQKLCLYYHSVDSCSALEHDLHWNSVRLTYQLPRVIDSAAIKQALNAHTETVLEQQTELLRHLAWILPFTHQLKSLIKKKQGLDQLDAVQDIHVQLAQLIYPHFLNHLSVDHLGHYPRYLKAIHRRLEKLDFEAHKDRALRKQVNAWQNDYDALPEGQRYSEIGADFFWLLQEYRVSLFAQELGTFQRVSDKALNKAWLALKAHAK